MVLISTVVVLALTILYFSVNVRKYTIAEAKRLSDVFAESIKPGSTRRLTVNKETLFNTSKK